MTFTNIDGKQAHTMVTVKKKGWKYQAAQIGTKGKANHRVIIKNTGTYGVSSAQLWRGRPAALITRLAIHMTLAAWLLLFVFVVLPRICWPSTHLHQLANATRWQTTCQTHHCSKRAQLYIGCWPQQVARGSESLGVRLLGNVFEVLLPCTRVWLLLTTVGGQAKLFRASGCVSASVPVTTGLIACVRGARACTSTCV